MAYTIILRKSCHKTTLSRFMFSLKSSGDIRIRHCFRVRPSHARIWVRC